MHLTSWENFLLDKAIKYSFICNFLLEEEKDRQSWGQKEHKIDWVDFAPQLLQQIHYRVLGCPQRMAWNLQIATEDFV